LGTHSLVNTINTGIISTPSTIAHATHAARIYILYPRSGSIYIGDTTTMRQSEILSRLQQPVDIAFNSMRALGYVTESAGDRISIIDTTSQDVIGTFEGFNKPRGIAATRDGRTAFVANSGNNTIARVRL
jgi:DNA-binding beta-propeller fold protein YncE